MLFKERQRSLIEHIRSLNRSFVIIIDESRFIAPDLFLVCSSRILR